MIIGTKNIFAIEWYHEPIGEKDHLVFGRMCLWINNAVLGDINNKMCALSVSRVHLVHKQNVSNQNIDSHLNGLSDWECFDYLNQKLYLDESRTDEQISDDAKTYSKFDFLTNGGESFDHTKSFIVSDKGVIRILWTDRHRVFHSGDVDASEYYRVINPWISWCGEIG